MSQINNTFEYNGVSYEFDIRDAENSEKFENAVALMKVAEKNMPKTGRISAIYKASCEMIREFFDTILPILQYRPYVPGKLHQTSNRSLSGSS